MIRERFHKLLLFGVIIFISTASYCQFGNPAITTSGNPGLKNDSLALIKFYEATKDSRYWTGFRDWGNKPISSWYGLNFEKKGGEYRVTKLTLQGSYFLKLEGYIPKEIGNIEYLESIYFLYHNFNAGIPKEMGNLENLKTLSMQACNLTGQVPSTFNKLKNLENLNLGFNKMTGNPFNSISGIKNLKNLYINNNAFSGEFTVASGSLSKLLIINAGHNNFSGKLGDNILGMKNVTMVDFSDNLRLASRNILENLDKFPDLNNLDLDNTAINGTFPDVLKEQSKLVYLDLDSTGLKGAIPESVNKLVNLQELYIARNEVDELPVFKSLKNLEAPENSLDFGDIEKNLRIIKFRYYPQEDLYTERDIVIREGSTLIIHGKVEGKSNIYQWRKEFIRVGENTEDLTVENFSKEQSGKYACTIKNKLATKGSLRRRPITVSTKVRGEFGPDFPATIDGDIGIDDAKYYWSTGSKKKKVTINEEDGDTIRLTITIGNDVTIKEEWVIEKPWYETPPKPEKIIAFKNILFKQGTSEIISGKDELDKLAKMMEAYPDVRIMVMGHTDNQGDPRKNQLLSENRASSIKSYLVYTKHIKKYRVSTKGFGDTMPIASNLKEVTRKLNRRVEFKVLASE